MTRRSGRLSGKENEWFERVMRGFRYVQSDFDDEAGWDRLAQAVQAPEGEPRNYLFYLATAPEQMWFGWQLITNLRTHAGFTSRSAGSLT